MITHEQLVDIVPLMLPHSDWEFVPWNEHYWNPVHYLETRPLKDVPVGGIALIQLFRRDVLTGERRNVYFLIVKSDMLTCRCDVLGAWENGIERGTVYTMIIDARREVAYTGRTASGTRANCRGGKTAVARQNEQG